MINCFYCQYKVEPSYKQIENLSKFLSPRKKILGRDKTGLCAKHQRKLTNQIKYARYLALLPYVSYQGLR
ncbi:30S ribosomal protein S18 [Candidatus Roizmanbacteria bacterium]|nr:30S ribosomal protein S18 [Candidatus Roizmanbacteria bacterium]